MQEHTSESSESVKVIDEARSAVPHNRKDEGHRFNYPHGPFKARILHFLICSTSVISFADLKALLEASLPALAGRCDLEPRIAIVPRYPPTSEEQAKYFSQWYWPTAYKGGNPFGPHPVLVARAAKEIQKDAGLLLELARRAGLGTSAECSGETIGAVIVDRSQGDGPLVAAAARDARWGDTGIKDRSGAGNPMAHAVMRAIGMIARKRQVLIESSHNDSGAYTAQWFADRPLTLLERDIYTRSTLSPGGYLCLDMELYITHEPCVMCSMAINHSRFGRVIFGKTMSRTGGLAVEGRSSNAYGLFWRPELNWKFLCWQYVTDEDLAMDDGDKFIHA